MIYKQRRIEAPKQYTSPLQYLHILNLLKLRVGLYENKLVLDLIRKDK